jgi:hypothetical protein
MKENISAAMPIAMRIALRKAAVVWKCGSVEGIRLLFENCSLAGVQSHHQVGEERKAKRNDGRWGRVLMEGDELWRLTGYA